MAFAGSDSPLKDDQIEDAAKRCDGNEDWHLPMVIGPVELNADSVNKALEAVKLAGNGHNLVVDTDALFAMDEDGAYPLVLTTYEIICSAGYDDQTRDLVKNFFKIVLESAQNEELEDLGYMPVDGDFKQKLADAVDAIQ